MCVIAIVGVCLWARHHTRKHNERTRLAADEQGDFTRVSEIELDKILDDPGTVPLDITDEDASDKEPFYRDGDDKGK